MKEGFDSGKKRFDGAAALLVTGFALRGSQESGAVTTVLRGGFAHWFGQRSQDMDSAPGAVSQQRGVIIASIQQQRLDGRRQIVQLRLQNMTFAGAARHASAQDGA